MATALVPEALSEMRLGMLTIFDGTPPIVILRAGGVDMFSQVCLHTRAEKCPSCRRPSASNIETRALAAATFVEKEGSGKTSLEGRMLTVPVRSLCVR